MIHNSHIFADQIIRGAKNSKQRTGQYIVSHLPPEIVNVLVQAGAHFDPYEKNLSSQEIYDWIENHLIFDGYNIVALFDGDDILWEKK